MATKMFRERVVLGYSEDVRGPAEPGNHLGPKIGRRWLQCEVLVEIDVEAIANRLGMKSVRSAGGKSMECSGLVVVKRVGKPMTVKEETNVSTGSA